MFPVWAALTSYYEQNKKLIFHINIPRLNAKDSYLAQRNITASISNSLLRRIDSNFTRKATFQCGSNLRQRSRPTRSTAPDTAARQSIWLTSKKRGPTESCSLPEHNDRWLTPVYSKVTRSLKPVSNKSACDAEKKGKLDLCVMLLKEY